MNTGEKPSNAASDLRPLRECGARRTGGGQAHERPELLVGIDTWVNAATRVPQIVVRLRVRGRPEQVFRSRTAGSCTEGTLWALLQLVRELDRPVHLRVGLDDPLAARLITERVDPPSWVRRVFGWLEHEALLGDHELTVEHLTLGDTIASIPLGSA